MESREMPATFYWNGTRGLTPGDADDPGNWWRHRLPLHGLPGPGDDVIFGVLLQHDDQITNCFNFDGTFRSVQVLPSYDQTITLEGPLVVDQLVMTPAPAGKIDQPDDGDGTDITVDGPDGAGDPSRPAFYWSSGEINSTDHLATVNLTDSGTNGVIEPINAGTVKLGSHIIQTGGSVLTMKAGTVEVTNDDQVWEVNDGCGGQVDPGPAGTFTWDVSGVFTDTTVYVKAGGYLRLLTGNWVHRGYAQSDGEVTLKSGTAMTLEGTTPGQPSYALNAGITRLEYGSKLTVSSLGMRVLSGKLVTAVGSAATTVATIKGNLRILGGNIVISDGSVPHVYGTLLVDGNVEWIGGTYRPVVQGDVDGGPADLWHATGTFTIGGTATIAPGTIDLEGNVTSGPDHAGMTWLILQGNGGITVQALPTIIGPFAIQPGPGNPPDQWHLIST